jgi:hypothetical protein
MCLRHIDFRTLYSTVISSQNNQALPPLPACQVGQTPVLAATTFTYLACAFFVALIFTTAAASADFGT